MILRLAREQMRAQKAYVLWTAVLLTVATALATFTWTFQSTNAAQETYQAEAIGEADGFGAIAVLTDVSDVTHEVVTDYGEPMTSRELGELLAAANAEGAGAVAKVWIGSAQVALDGNNGDGSYSTTAYVYSGAVDWGALLASGEAPRAGEVVLDATVAQDLGVGVGDPVMVSLTDEGWYAYPLSGQPDVPITLAGITYDGGTWATPLISGTVPTAIVGLEDARVLPRMAAISGFEWPEPMIQAYVTWSEPSETLNAAFTEVYEVGINSGSAVHRPEPLMLSVVLSAGLVVVAFAVGRAQAQVRVQWVATARALGATRRAVATSTLLEGLILGVIAGAVGMLAGYGVAAVSYEQYLASAVAPMPVPLTLSPLWFAALGLSAVALGLVVASVPAVFSARIAPSAALKDSPSVDESEVSRKVPVWPVVVIFIAAYVTVLATLDLPTYVPMLTGALAVLASGIALLVDLSRRTARGLAKVLSRSSSPALVKAGLDIAAHPRQAAALITIQAMSVGAMAIGAWAPTAFWRLGYVDGYWGEPNDVVWWVYQYPYGIGIAVSIVAAVLCVAVFAATRALGRSEHEISRALGLDRTRSRLADTIRFAFPQAIGAVGGAVAAVALGGLAIITLALEGLAFDSAVDAARALLASQGVTTLITLAIALAVIACTTGVAAMWSWRFDRGRSREDAQVDKSEEAGVR